jgi:adenylate cyclase
MDFAAAGLLDGLTGDERKARARLLRRLVDDGATLDQLKAAVAENRLALLPVDRVLGGSHTAREIEARTGVPAQFMVRWRRLLGLPEPGLDDRVFGDEDIEAANSTRLFLDAGFGEEAIAEITRVLGEGMGRLAATTAAAFVETFLQPGDSEVDVALRFAALAQRLTPAVKPILAGAFNQHLHDSVRRGVISRAELERGQLADEIELTVCFADLVGFTRLGGQVEVSELGSVAGGLARLAADAIVTPVRLIKTIGDAAMFVSPEPAPQVEVALSLVEAVQAADLPALRAGIAYGPAMLRAGDFYGHTVNVASRVTGIARPGSVLCTEELRNAAPDQFDWSFAGRHRLKGVPEPVPLYRARRLGADGDHAGRAKRRRADRPRRRAQR